VFKRIAIINRGEAAMRLINAVREINAAGAGRTETIALYTDGERTARFVREADIAYGLGPASARPYLDLAVLERALRDTGADAAWVGWGFVAEIPEFAELCERVGVTFIGPSAAAMRKLGDKIGSKLIAEQVGVPVAPWSQGAVADLDAALAVGEQLGYPLMLKATAGGGGRGIRKVENADELRAAFRPTSDEALRAFGSGVMFLETLVTGARHVEVQIIADGQGSAWAVGVRDCSIQRRNQKVIEESASPVVDPEHVAEVKAAAERLAVEVGYAGAGTVEFLYQPADQQFAFLEVNTRLQVEHPITEIVTGLDLVKLQLHVAEGGRLEGERPAEVGHAVEARLNAEDPDRDFAPAPGRIARLDLPAGPGVRVDTGFSTGDPIPADFDSMIAKIIAYGPDRAQALARLRRALADTTVVIEGGATNKTFLITLLGEAEVIDGSADTGWIDRVRAGGRLIATHHSGIALIAAAIEAYEENEAAERAHFLATAHGGRPQARHDTSRAIDLKLRGDSHRVVVSKVGPRRFRASIDDDGRVVDVALERLDEYASRLDVGDQRFRLITATHGAANLIEVDGVTHRVMRDEGGILRSPAPALVVAVPVAIGDELEAGTPVLVLESMKMETVIPAPFRCRVRELMVATGAQVEAGIAMIRLEPISDDEEEEAGPAASSAVPTIELPGNPATTAAAEAADCLADLNGLLLGFDLSATAAVSRLADYERVRAELVGAGTSPLPAEVSVFSAFADLCELGRNRPAANESGGDTRVHSPREYFHSYLHSLDADREHLPEAFRGRLSRVLRHYDVTDLERTPALEEAVFRLFLAQPAAASHLNVVTTLLQQWLADEPPGETCRDAVRDVLDRLVAATQLRYPVVGDLARSVRFRWFEEPEVGQARADALERASQDLAYLDAHPDAPDFEERIDRLAATSEPVAGQLSERMKAGLQRPEPLLEVLARRHYREYELSNLQSPMVDGRPFVTCDYVLDERPTHLVSTIADISELEPGSALLAAIDAMTAAAPAGHQTVIDLFLHWADVPEWVPDAADHLLEVLTRDRLLHRSRRVAVALCPGDERPVHYVTFRPDNNLAQGEDDSVYEDDLVRGIHPMVGRRLDLWRLRQFDLTRLVDAPEDVLLYHCVAPDNPEDQRLVAMAQVRELTVVRDAEGHVTALPNVERAITVCTEALRRARQARGGSGPRLDMNYVFLHIWPAIDAPVEELTAMQHTISPLTVGAGIEEIMVYGRIATPSGTPREVRGHFYYRPGAGVVADVVPPVTQPLLPLDDYAQKVIRARRRGNTYPYELIGMLTGARGSFAEYELDDSGALAITDRPPGRNPTGIVVGVITTPTTMHPEGVTRVALFGDPLKSLGSLGVGECDRVCAAIDLARRLEVPVEWYALSAGARIAMDSGTENMDAVARALKAIVEFTQDGGEINVVVAGINVGAQPYWNAEATMLMHTRGVLIMTPDSAMVLTGKQSLDYSGGVSAEDNFGIGGYDRVMGPNGQAQYWVPNLAAANTLLLSYYDHTYIARDEVRPRRAPSTDPVDRDISSFPHVVADSEFKTVGDIFSPLTNPDRKKPFDIRTLMRAVSDQDHPVLERWAGMADADTSVVFDAHVGGFPVCLIGIESRPIPRRGFPPSDGPDIWTAGTLFPRSSKKTARAINAASGNRPVVVLANLSGFDGSPDSMRNLQLEYGAEIGRAIVNFDGPIVFCVVSRYHGGAFVVFSKALNANMTVLALEGSFASVLGGAPAANVVFSGDVDRRTAADARIGDLTARLGEATGVDRAALATELVDVRASVRQEKLAEVAVEFDSIHSIHRAQQVGSVDEVIEARSLRPRIIRVIADAAV
jgi:acetyl/propionyl-CoA carboxylase alpha subunit/acetyl-CoA carboxylase carboxyltransferase component